MIRRIAAFAVSILFPAMGWAGDMVTLTTLDGSRTVEGELVAFEAGYYRIKTDAGALTLDGGDVTCSGAACPTSDALITRTKFVGPAEMIHRLVPMLLERYAEDNGLKYNHIFLFDDRTIWELSIPELDQIVAVIEGEVVADQAAHDMLRSRDVTLAFGRFDGGRGIDADVIALDALVPVVALDNPLTEVTQAQFRDVLAGRIRNWSDLNGVNNPVHVMLAEARLMDSDLARVFPKMRIRRVERDADIEGLAARISDDPTAFGVVPLSMMGNTMPLVIRGACGLASPATDATVKSEDYPLTQPLFLFRNAAHQPRIVRDFVAFVRSPEAQSAIRAAGFVDQGIGRVPFERQGHRLANAVLTANDDRARLSEVQRMVVELMQGHRLTLTFRFEDGASTLDVQSRSNVRRLADAIRHGEFEGEELVFVGFTDGEGPEDGNLRLSKRRANSVRKEVLKFLGGADIDLIAEGFGEIVPMACDDTDWGRQVNRRVEVWVREPSTAHLR